MPVFEALSVLDRLCAGQTPYLSGPEKHNLFRFFSHISGECHTLEHFMALCSGVTPWWCSEDLMQYQDGTRVGACKQTPYLLENYYLVLILGIFLARVGIKLEIIDMRYCAKQSKR